MKRSIIRLFSLALCAALCCGGAQAASGSAADVLSTALGELDTEEAAGGWTKYGERYGYPTGAWCDMFVSWCAERAGVSTEDLPADISCTSHVKQFTELDRYHRSASRGGSYEPRQGDLVFFYNYLRYPEGSVSGHVGLVLCAEDGYLYTVEGNTLTNRQDYSHYEDVIPAREYGIETPDYVCVKRYALSDPCIHGYAVPDYADRTPLAHDGYVDLGQYAARREAFDTLAALGIMPGTSEYTYSPRCGMARGDFVAAVTALLGIGGGTESDAPFDDVPEGSPWYGAVFAAQAAGLIRRGEDGLFYPERSISGADAQAILSRACAYVGVEARDHDFGEGDFSYLLTPYTIRADLAQALYETLRELPVLAEAPLPAEELPEEPLVAEGSGALPDGIGQ